MTLWPGSPSCSRWPTSSKAPKNPALAGPGLLPHCSRLAKSSCIRAVFSRAGGMSGLDKRGHGNCIKPSRPLPRSQPSPQATSTPPPPRPGFPAEKGGPACLPWRASQGSSSPPPVVFAPAALYHPKHLSSRLPASLNKIRSAPGQGPLTCRLCALVTPGMQTQSRLPAFAQPSALGRLQSPADIYPTIAQANFLQLTFMARELFVAAPTPAVRSCPPLPLP